MSACVKKLAIRGIRSFAPDKEETIEFYSPLTMIVGQNGCGKTTIIECLKMACTGTLPPGSRSGQSFVHDPKQEEGTEVKASIKMRVEKGENSIVVVRSFSLKSNKASLTFKALDGVVRYKKAGAGEKDNKESVSYKCSDLDKTVPVWLQVSKAILENVIFCHQEESNWPLQEGKVVKQKFDDIFESTRYTKALDSIRKTKVEYAGKVKDIKVDLASLTAHVQAADTFQKDFDERQAEHTALMAEITGIEEQLGTLEARKAKLRQLQQEVGQMERERAALEQRMREDKAVLAEKEDRLKSAQLEETHRDLDDEGLRNLIRDSEQRMKEALDVAKEAGKRGDALRKEQSEKKRLHAELLQKKGGLESQMREQARLVKERDSMVKRIAEKYNITVPATATQASQLAEGESVLTDAGVKTFTTALKKKLEQYTTDLNKARKEAREKEDVANSELSKLQAEQRMGEAQAARLSSDKNEAENKLRSINAELRQSSQVSQESVQSKEREAQEATGKVNELRNKDPNKDNALTNRLKELETEMAALDNSIRTTSLQLKEQADSADRHRTVTIKGNQAKEEQKRLDDALAENEEKWRKFLDQEVREARPEALGDALRQLHDKKATSDAQFKEKQAAHTKAQSTLIEKETELRQVNSQLGGVKRQLDVFETPLKEIKQVLESAHLEMDHPLTEADAALRELKEAEEKAREAMQDAKHWLWWSDKAKAMATKKKNVKKTPNGLPLCPCCCREMEQDIYEGFIATMDEAKASHAQKYEEKAVALQSIQEQVQKLERNMGQWYVWKQEEPKLAALQTKSTTITEEIERLKAEVHTKNEELKTKQNDRKALDDVLREVEGVIRDADRVAKLRAHVESEKRLMCELDEGANTTELEEKLRAKRAEKDAKTKESNDAQRRMQEYMSNMLKVQNRETVLTRVARDEKAKWDKQETLQQSKKQWQEVGKAKGEELQKLSEEQIKRANDIREKEMTKNRERQAFQAKDASDQAILTDCTGEVRGFDRTQHNLVAALQRDVRKELAQLEEKLREVREIIPNLQKDIEVSDEQVYEVEARAATNESFKELIEQHLTVRKLRKDVQSMKTELTTTAQKIRTAERNLGEDEDPGAPGQDLYTRMRAIDGQMEKLKETKAERKGKVSSLQERLSDIANQLKSKNYKGVKEKHRRKTQEYETTQMAVADLEKYWTALDKALLSFHSMKIGDINKCVKELWEVTYQGKDIDTIEIVSGEEGESTRAKRSYNYRVVMRKNGVNLDMKGRCSAGQRVLASIVIRMALARCFCLNCGILALDEPTTNLDMKNKEGLAVALARLIAEGSRKTVKGDFTFQLIVITHDEDFVSTMRQELSTQVGASMPEHFWMVSREQRNGKYYSKVTRKDWEELG